MSSPHALQLQYVKLTCACCCRSHTEAAIHKAHVCLLLSFTHCSCNTQSSRGLVVVVHTLQLQYTKLTCACYRRPTHCSCNTQSARVLVVIVHTLQLQYAKLACACYRRPTHCSCNTQSSRVLSSPPPHTHTQTHTHCSCHT